MPKRKYEICNSCFTETHSRKVYLVSLKFTVEKFTCKLLEAKNHSMPLALESKAEV